MSQFPPEMMGTSKEELPPFGLSDRDPCRKEDFQPGKVCILFPGLVAAGPAMVGYVGSGQPSPWPHCAEARTLPKQESSQRLCCPVGIPWKDKARCDWLLEKLCHWAHQELRN